MKKVLQEIEQEVNRAKLLHPGEFHIAHEGYAVLLEEVRELEQAVFFGRKQCKLNRSEHMKGAELEAQIAVDYKNMMREEAIQIAAMAVRFANELC